MTSKKNFSPAIVAFNVIGEVAYVIEMSMDVTETTILRRRFDLLFERVPCYVAVIDRDLKIAPTGTCVRTGDGS